MLTEPLTDAGAAGDGALVAYCRETAFDDDDVRVQARRLCAGAINEARGMDDSEPYVEVVP